MIVVQVTFYGGVERFARLDAREVQFEVPTGITLGQLLDRLQLPPAPARTVLIDGRLVSLCAVLSDGARVSVFPALAGG